MDNYEEKYKAALGWMKGLYSGLHGATKEEAEKYFPELKESEEERIRKKVIEVLKLNIKGAESQMQASRGVDRCFEIYACNKVIAWLEKQGHMLDSDKVIEWLNDQACQGWIEDVEVDIFVDKFKEDFGL